MTDLQKQYLEQCRDRYHTDFLEDIMPFWLKNGLDTVNGGVYTCLDRDGSLMDSTKSVWFQGRFGFICAYAYNHIEKNADWLAASRSCIDFIEEYCIDADHHMFFTVTAEGEPVQKRRYVFSECFAAMAMAEYSKATGDQTYANKALNMFLSIRRMMSTPGFLAPKTYIKGRSHSITMMLINVALIVKQVISDPALDQQIEVSLYDIEHYLIHSEFKALMETVTPDGHLMDTCSGRTINPGHCIETAWFIMETAKMKGNDSHLNDLALKIFDWSYDWGWDNEFGGIINFKDCRNFPNQDYSQDMKFWWPQCETIIASLYAYKLTKDEKYLSIHKLIHEWAYDHFQDKEYGEWYGYLHRDGTVAQPAKGNIFKGPFHIPRMMIKSYLLINEILAEKE